MAIAGIALSVQPDLLIRSAGADGKPRIGAAIFSLAKAPDPIGCRLEETRKSRGDHRREMARYMVAMLEMLLDAHADEFGKADRALCFVADIRLGERIGADPTMLLGCGRLGRHVIKSLGSGQPFDPAPQS